jgi:hypothetical protein
MSVSELLFWFSIAIALSACSGKKKDAVQPVYQAPEIELPDDEDLDDLPEAGEDQ